LISNVKKSCHYITPLHLIIATEDFVMWIFQCWYSTKQRIQSRFEINWLIKRQCDGFFWWLL